MEYFNRRSPTTKIRVVDDLSTGSLENLAGLNFDFDRLSIVEPEGLIEAFSGSDCVIHLGAIGSVPRSIEEPVSSHLANATGTLNVLEAARSCKVERVLIASSSSVYGANPAKPKSELDWIRPLSPYAASKAAAEAYSFAYNSSYGLRTLVFRFFNVYGPKQRADHPYAAVIPRFIDSALRGKPITIYGDGLQSRDFTYVKSVCQALYLAVERGVESPEPINLAYGTETTLLQLAEIISDKTGDKVEIRFEPSRVGDVRSSQSDPTAFSKLLSSASPTPLSTGISETIDWFRKEVLK